MTTIINFLFVSSLTWNLTHSVVLMRDGRRSVNVVEFVAREVAVFWFLEIVIFGVRSWPPGTIDVDEIIICSNWPRFRMESLWIPRFIGPGSSQHCHFVYTYLELKCPSKPLCVTRSARGTDVLWSDGKFVISSKNWRLAKSLFTWVDLTSIEIVISCCKSRHHFYLELAYVGIEVPGIYVT